MTRVPGLTRRVTRVLGLTLRVASMDGLPAETQGIRDLLPRDPALSGVTDGGGRDDLPEPLEIAYGPQHRQRRLGVLQVPDAVVELRKLVFVEPGHPRIMTAHVRAAQ